MLNAGILKPVKLPYMQSYCFYFSVRLGVIIIGILTLVQSLVLILALSYGLKYPKWVTNQIEEMVKNDHGVLHTVLKCIALDLNVYFVGVLLFCILLFISCVLLVWGGFKCQDTLSYVFVGVYFIYVGMLFIGHVALMIILKQNDWDLGSISLFSILGGFMLLILYYNWFCVLSFCQIVQQLRTQMQQLAAMYTANPYTITKNHYC